MTNPFKHLAGLVLLFVAANSTLAQNGRTMNWFFGEKAGLSFKPSLHADTLGKLITDEGCASISDTCGNLLFYTDGITVYARNHQVMSNGTGLDGNPSSTQSALIIPKPLNDSIYYIFTTAGSAQYYCYSTVNMKANGGLGAVISKNDTICGSSGEKQAGIQHCNGTDYWVVYKKPFFTDTYYSFLVSSGGVNTTPVVSVLPYAPYADGIGYLKFSPNGNYLANAHSSLQDTVSLMTFNKCSGQVSYLTRMSVDTAVYGLSFSPDNTKLYAATTLYSFYRQSFLYQYNVSSGNPSAILASKTLIKALPNDSTYFGALQQGADGKIYITKYKASGYLETSLSVITQPNLSGSASNYQDNVTSLSGRKAHIGLPSFVESFFNRSSQCSSVITGLDQETLSEGFSFYPNPFSDQTYLRIPSGAEEALDLVLYNALGAVCKEVKSIRSREFVLEKGGLAPGIYYFHLKNGERSAARGRLIIE